ncbi:type II secretion system F family protein [Geobacter sp. FeAm09]|uniref:type II secretion system F family protein n=1 Tax=Geobacter sp. FeAm09 TaxID=2597769 RepID=UPI0011ED081D|nr:type II secretion system F family protein [Geobacter sp. FeAm09]QEM68877.1 type II secretion system F family protein [Geobacter sp. FeAm09]
MIKLIVGSVFVSIALITGTALYWYISRRMVVKERLSKLVVTPLAFEAPTLIAKPTPLSRFLSRLGAVLPQEGKDRSKYEKLLVSAGYRKSSLVVFFGCKVLLTLLFPTLFMMFVTAPTGKIANQEMLLVTVALAIIGFLLPSVYVQRRSRMRKLLIFQTLPDILDLLTICVEAGMSIDAAMLRACENPQFKGNPLAEEMKISAMETRAGKSRPESLRDMAERTDEDDLRAFVTMLIQTERFGTSLSQALRVHSDSLRVRRRQIAEEAAAKTAVKMLFPLVFFIFPALLIVMLGPAIIKIGQIFK